MPVERWLGHWVSAHQQVHWYLVPGDLSSRCQAGQSQGQDREVRTILEILARFRDLPPDPTECGCLKTLVLFQPETRGLREVRAVELLQVPLT